LNTADGSPLHLVVFLTSSGELQGQYIVGDGCAIKVDAQHSTMFGLLALLMCYYVFDINYPQQYAMVLAVLQTFVMEEPYCKETCQRFKFFLKKLRPIFNRIPISEPEGVE
jgi:hypothetical protein